MQRWNPKEILIPTLTEGEGNGDPLQYSRLGNPKDRGAWQVIVYGIAELDMTERLTHWPRREEKKTKWLENRIHRKHLCLKEGVTFAWVLQWIAAHLILWGLQRGASFAQCVMMWLVWDMLTGQRRGEPQNPVKLSRKWSVEKRQWWKSGAGNRPRNDELFKRKPRN